MWVSSRSKRYCCITPSSNQQQTRCWLSRITNIKSPFIKASSSAILILILINNVTVSYSSNSLDRDANQVINSRWSPDKADLLYNRSSSDSSKYCPAMTITCCSHYLLLLLFLSLFDRKLSFQYLPSKFLSVSYFLVSTKRNFALTQQSTTMGRKMRVVCSLAMLKVSCYFPFINVQSRRAQVNRIKGGNYFRCHCCA